MELGRLRHPVAKVLLGTGLSARVYSFVMSALVLVLCTTFVIETYPIPAGTMQWLLVLDKAIVTLFVIDYILRFWIYRFSIRYLFTPFALIDLLAILPLFIPSANWHFVRVLRLFRILRLLRLFASGHLFGWQLTKLRLSVMRIFFTLFCLVFISSGLIFDIEHQQHPETFQTFFDALYFTIVSLSTVGYGDIVPASTGGRAVTILMLASGAVLIPWQLTSLARHFLLSERSKRGACPRCDLAMHEADANFCKRCGERLQKIAP